MGSIPIISTSGENRTDTEGSDPEHGDVEKGSMFIENRIKRRRVEKQIERKRTRSRGKREKVFPIKG